MTVGDPSPKFQFHPVIGSVVGEPEVDASVKLVLVFRQTAFTLIPATGSGLMVAGRLVVLWHPLSEVAVRKIAKGPSPVNAWQGF